MDNSKKVLFYLCGKSGAGKDSVLRNILHTEKVIPYDNVKLTNLINTTNRGIRPGEKDGVDYHFVTTEEFKDKIKREEFFSVAVFHTYDENGNPFDAYYGYPKPTEKFSIITGPYEVMMNLINNLTPVLQWNQDFPYGKYYTSMDGMIDMVPIYLTLEHNWEYIYRMVERELIRDKPRIKEACRRFCADMEAFPDIQTIRNMVDPLKVITNTDIVKASSEVDAIIWSKIKEVLENE